MFPNNSLNQTFSNSSQHLYPQLQANIPPPPMPSTPYHPPLPPRNWCDVLAGTNRQNPDKK